MSRNTTTFDAIWTKDTQAGPLPFSVQKMIYNYLIINLILMSTLIFNPRAFAPFIKHKKVLGPMVFVFFVCLAVFLNDTFREFTKLKENVPEVRSNDNLEWLRWQKKEKTEQRDFYLSLAAMLAQGMVIVVCFWIDKVEEKEQEIVALQKRLDERNSGDKDPNLSKNLQK